MSKVHKFRKLPVVIEAMYWNGTAEDAVPIIQWVLDGDGNANYRHKTDPGEDTSTISIGTLEGTMRASAGDWIIRGVKGEHYPIKADILEETYERERW
jgi:hypothetical protein